jgi:hypothetical protein
LRSDEAQFLGGSRDSMVLRGSGDGTGGEDTLPYSTRSLYVMKNHSNNKAINTTFSVVVFFTLVYSVLIRVTIVTPTLPTILQSLQA